MAAWLERSLTVAGTAVAVVPHAWERAARDILDALGGRGRIVRGAVRYARVPSGLQEFPHTPALRDPAAASFKDVLKVQKYWFTWVEDDRGRAIEPLTLFPEIEPPRSSWTARSLVAFPDHVQALLDQVVPHSLDYHIHLLSILDNEAPRTRSLDRTETKPWGDILMLRALDRVSAFKTPPFRSDGSGRVVMTRRVRRMDLIAAIPVDAIVMHSTFIREFVCSDRVRRAFGYPTSALDEEAGRRARHAACTWPFEDIARQGMLVGDADILMALCMTHPGDDTVYQGHRVRATEDSGEANVSRLIVRTSGGKTLHYLIIADRDIAEGEELVTMHDMVSSEILDAIMTNRAVLDAAPRQECIAFTDMLDMVSCK